MKKFIFPIICSLVLLLSACGKSTPPESTNTPVDTNPMVNSGSSVNTGFIAPLSKDTQAIIEIQLKKPDAILTLDCTTYDVEGTSYCNAEKDKMIAIFKEETWQKVLAKDDEYIKTFDCTKLTSTFGHKYCTEHQEKIAKAPPATSSGANTPK